MYVMRSRPTDCLWMGSAFGAALIVATIVIMVFGAGERGTATALRVSARFSFLLFWIAYAGSPLTALFGATFQPLKKRARVWSRLCCCASRPYRPGRMALLDRRPARLWGCLSSSGLLSYLLTFWHSFRSEICSRCSAAGGGGCCGRSG